MSAQQDKDLIMGDSGSSNFLKVTLRAAWNEASISGISRTLNDLNVIYNLLSKRRKEQEAANSPKRNG
jgi:hypothetical protein